MSPQTKSQTGSRANGFGSLRAVVLLSVLTIVLLFAYSLLYLTPAFTELIAQNTENTAVLVATHIEKDLFTSGRPFARETLPPEFNAKIVELVNNFHLMKIKVFAPNGETIFSTEATDIGVINEHDYFHQVVAKGRPFTKIVKKDSNSLEGQKVSVDVVETYVPAMSARGDFLGAFEIYLDITKRKAYLDHLVAHANRLLYAVSAALLTVMLFLANRARTDILARRLAEAKIIQQSIVLEETNKDLSILNEISAAISQASDMDSLLTEILDTIAARFSSFSKISRGGIFLVAGDKLVPTAHLRSDDELPCQHQEISFEECLCGQAARTGEVILSANSAQDPRHTLFCNQVAPHGHIIIPLTSHNSVEGVLYLLTDVDVRIDGKGNLLQSIGRQVGLAINNTALYQQTRQMALSDQLTGLPNRRFMQTRLDEAVRSAERYGRPLSIAMIDIDYFKKYNDTMGHAAGDLILAKVGAIIRKEIRESDFAARYGGEEFMVVMAETERCGACMGMERIRRSIEQKAGVTISIGVTSYRPGLLVPQLVKEADDALYQAKADGRNRVVWSGAVPGCHETAS